MNGRVAFWIQGLFLSLVLLGCEPPQPAASNSTAPPAPPPPPTEPAPAEIQASEAPAGDGIERVKAEKGVGLKGRSLDQYEGVLVTPAKAYFTVRERIVFEDQIPHALNLYKASEGQGPRSHDEFMEKIVQFNRIKLPQLPPDAKYVYDVEQEMLMVERPKKQ